MEYLQVNLNIIQNNRPAHINVIGRQHQSLHKKFYTRAYICTYLSIRRNYWGFQLLTLGRFDIFIVLLLTIGRKKTKTSSLG